MILRRKIMERLQGTDECNMEAASEGIGGGTEGLNCTLGLLISVFVPGGYVIWMLFSMQVFTWK